MAYPNPLILFSLDSAILKANALKIKVKKTPTINNNEKFQIAPDLNNPYAIKGMANPKIKL